MVSFIGNNIRPDGVGLIPPNKVIDGKYKSIIGNGSGLFTEYLSLNELVHTRDSEAYLLNDGTLTHFPNLHQIAYRMIGGFPHILTEDEGTNLVDSNLVNPLWVATNLETPVLANDPLGNLGAWRIIPDATAGMHGKAYAFTPDGSSDYCLSAIVSGDDYDWVQLEFSAAGFPNTPNCYFNLSTGVTGTATDCIAGIEQITTGWYLIWITATSDAAAATNASIRVAEADTDNSFSGDSIDYITVFCPQVETGAFPTSRIRSTNLLTYSNHYTAATSTWLHSRCTITEAGTVAPDGISIAEIFAEDSTPANTHVINQVFTPDGSSQYCFSMYVKPKEKTKIRMTLLGGGFPATPYADFDLSDGTVYYTYPSLDGSGIEELPNNWYRIYITCTSNAASADSLRIYLLDNSYNQSYDGDGSSGLYLWGVQVEFGASPSQLQITGANPGGYRDSADVYGLAADIPSWVYTGKFKIIWTPECDYDQLAADVVLLHPAGNAAMLLKYDIGDGTFQLTDLATGKCVESSAATFSRGNTIELTCDYANAELTVSGATTGNGTTIGTAWSWSGNLWLGSDGTDYCYGIITPSIRA